MKSRNKKHKKQIEILRLQEQEHHPSWQACGRPPECHHSWSCVKGPGCHMDSFGRADVLRPFSLLASCVCRPMTDGWLKWREGMVTGTLRQLPKSEQGIACPLSAASVTSSMTLPRQGSQEAWKQSSDFALFSLKLRPVVVWLAWDTAKCQVCYSVLRSDFDS